MVLTKSQGLFIKIAGLADPIPEGKHYTDLTKCTVLDQQLSACRS